MSRKFTIAVSLLVVLAVTFGLAGTFAPPLPDETPVPQQESSTYSASSNGHFQNPPSYDSGWVDIHDKSGQYINLRHGLNTTEVFVDVTGKESIDYSDGPTAFVKTYGGANHEYALSVIQARDGGYAVAGYTNSYGSGGYDFWLAKTDADGDLLWNQPYGGTQNDHCWSVIQTEDNGYALVGWTASYGAGGFDFWLVKTNSAGAMDWSRPYGGTSDDRAFSVIQTDDGGYAIVGYTFSFGIGTPSYANAYLVKTYADGTVDWVQTYGGPSGDYAYSLMQTEDGYAIAGYTTSSGAGGADFWLIRTDSDGNMLWNYPYGGTGTDYGMSGVHTRDGGFALTGWTASFGAGGFDFWLVKTDSGGNMLWNRTYGGSKDDNAYSVIQTADGGYAIAGYTRSYGSGITDFWLVKTDLDGNILWREIYGGTSYDQAYSVVQTVDGGYALAGDTMSYGAGGHDILLVKKDSAIEMQWSKTYGGSSSDYAYSVVQTFDGGYALAGSTNSFGAGGFDFWLIKTDASGGAQWSRTYGGANTEYAYSMVQTVDGGYALAGTTTSYGAGGYDFWLVKTDSAGNTQWSKTYGGSSTDLACSVVQTVDGGYALAGYTASFGAGSTDLWLVKTDSSGNMLWNHPYGGTDYEQAYSVIQTVDGGYILAGFTGSKGAGGYDYWLIKTYADGTVEWDQTYGGTSTDEARCVIQTVDGGYALAGTTASFGAGVTDMWLIKTDSAGNMQWNQTYGGANQSVARSMVQTSDGGYALAGSTATYGAGGYLDVWLIKTDSAGIRQWSKTYGGSSADWANSLIQTSDSGYALAGYADSYNAVGGDFLFVKVDCDPSLEHKRHLGETAVIHGWNQIYEEVGDDQARSMVEADDGSYVIAGFGPEVGVYDSHLLKVDSDGAYVWLRTYGGTGYDDTYSLTKTADGGYALAGSTNSPGDYDFWLVKTDSAGNMEWSQTYGYSPSSAEGAYSVIQTSDGGYALGGYTTETGTTDAWLVKTDSAGSIQWSTPFGGAGSDTGWCVVQTKDGGYALAGSTVSPDSRFYSWLAKFNHDGILEWSETYGEKWSFMFSVVQTYDGGYALGAQGPGPGFEMAWLIKTDAFGNAQWNRTYAPSSLYIHQRTSVIQIGDEGYAIAAGSSWLAKTDSAGNVQWNKTYGFSYSYVYSILQTRDGAYALAGRAYLPSGPGFWLATTDAELGLMNTALTTDSITLYRGRTDLDWNYVRVRIWTIEEPTWLFGDINMDGIVDAKDLYIVGRNYGKTFSLLSFSGIIAVAGIQTIKAKWKRSKQPS